MEFLRNDSLRCKIFVGKIFLQHVKNCKYLCCEICYESEKNIQQNVTKFAQILGILNSTFKSNLVQKFSIKKVFDASALSILLHGSEIWILRKKDKKQLTLSEMKILRRTAWYTVFDHKSNEEIFGRFENSAI